MSEKLSARERLAMTRDDMGVDEGGPNEQSDRILSRELVNEWRELGPVVVREEDVYQSHEALRERVEELEGSVNAAWLGSANERILELEAEVERLREGLELIRLWLIGYGIDWERGPGIESSHRDIWKYVREALREEGK